MEDKEMAAAHRKFEDMENLYRWLAQKLDA
jgi:hypothetical protein